MSKNLSLADLFISRVNFVKKFPFVVSKFSRPYRNFPSVLWHFQTKRYPVVCELRNGGKITINSERELWYNMLHENKILNGKEFDVSFDHLSEIVTITKHFNDGKKYSLSDSINNGDIWGIYLQSTYADLPVENKVVVDIGANIGDSSLYFVLKGAQRVIAFEPFPNSYRIARHNIESNNLLDRVVLSMSGCGGSAGFVYLNPDHSNALSQLDGISNEGLKVPIKTLQEIVEESCVPNGSVLKMDCEGCEYDSINCAPSDVLKKFSYVQLEYHYGYRNLKLKLQNLGFSVKVQRPTRWKHKETGKIFYAGKLIAKNANYF